MSSTLKLNGKVVSKGWCEFQIDLTPASKKLIQSKQGKMKSPIKQNLLKLKPNQFCHGRENLAVGADVSITVKVSYFQYSSDAKFKTITSTGVSVSPILIELKSTKR
jgi:hypothetical protein